MLLEKTQHPFFHMTDVFVTDVSCCVISQFPDRNPQGQAALSVMARGCCVVSVMLFGCVHGFAKVSKLLSA